MISQLLFSFGFLFCQERADRLRRILKSRIVRIYLYLGKNAGNAFIDASVEKLLPQLVGDIVSDIALAHCRADGQRKMRVLLRVLSRKKRHGILDNSYLRTVSVCDDHFIAFLDEISDRLHSICN